VPKGLNGRLGHAALLSTETSSVFLSPDLGPGGAEGGELFTGC
jgi:hypothetical protein